LLLLTAPAVDRYLLPTRRAAANPSQAAAAGEFDTTRDAVLTCAQKLIRVSLINRTEPTTKQWKTEKVKNGYAQKYRQAVVGIRGVSPEEEKEGYVGKDLQKMNVLRVE